MGISNELLLDLTRASYLLPLLSYLKITINVWRRENLTPSTQIRVKENSKNEDTSLIYYYVFEILFKVLERYQVLMFRR